MDSCGPPFSSLMGTDSALPRCQVSDMKSKSRVHHLNLSKFQKQPASPFCQKPTVTIRHIDPTANRIRFGYYLVGDLLATCWPPVGDPIFDAKDPYPQESPPYRTAPKRADFASDLGGLTWHRGTAVHRPNVARAPDSSTSCHWTCRAVSSSMWNLSILGTLGILGTRKKPCAVLKHPETISKPATQHGTEVTEVTEVTGHLL